GVDDVAVRWRELARRGHGRGDLRDVLAHERGQVRRGVALDLDGATAGARELDLHRVLPEDAAVRPLEVPRGRAPVRGGLPHGGLLDELPVLVAVRAGRL